MKHVLSFDFEEWFHIISNNSPMAHEDAWDLFSPRLPEMTFFLLDFLDQKKIKATFFILGWIAKKYPELICEILRRGHEIGCHSHLHQPVWSLSPKEFESDLNEALDAISDAGGVRPIIFRAPGFSINRTASLWAFDILASHGIEMDSSIYPGKHSHGGISSAPVEPFIIKTLSGQLIKEFPISTAKIFQRSVTFSGGGFFRLIPIFLLLKYFSSHSNKGIPVVTYFHPRDFDNNLPKSGLGWLRDFKNNLNVSNALSKLSILSDSFEFSTLSAVSESINWQTKNIYTAYEI